MFAGLKTKMSSIVNEDRTENVAKGVNCFALLSRTHDLYRDAIVNGTLMLCYNIRLGARKHALQTIANRKISPSFFHVKRFIQDDGATCLPFGHFEFLAVLRQIAAHDGWSSVP